MPRVKNARPEVATKSRMGCLQGEGCLLKTRTNHIHVVVRGPPCRADTGDCLAGAATEQATKIFQGRHLGDQSEDPATILEDPVLTRRCYHG